MAKPITGHQYEHIVADYLKAQGYTNVKATKASGDYGVDVIAAKGKDKYAVQCKYYGSPVSQAAVREVVAGKAFYGCNKAMVVTNNTYTKSAMELAKKNEVILLSNVSGSVVLPKHPVLKVIGFILLWACSYGWLAEALELSSDSSAANVLLISCGLVTLLLFSKTARHLLGRCLAAIKILFSKTRTQTKEESGSSAVNWIDDVESYDAIMDNNEGE